MQDKIKPGDITTGKSDETRPMADIPVRLNKLPWERNPSEDVDRDDADREDAGPAELPDRSAPGQSAAQPYVVGTRTYANPQTAVDSAASEKLFSMTADEYEEDRSRIRVFFDVLLGKIWKLMSLNMLVGLFNLPALLFMVFFSIYYMQLLQPTALTSTADGSALAYLLVGYLPLAMTFLSIPVVAFGPGQAGMHYLLRNYSYEVPVFLWGDFKEKMKENMKQGLIVTFINLFVFILAMLDIYMYPRMMVQAGAWLLVANYLLVLAFVIFMMVCMYIYPMMIRYDLTLKNLYRNAFLMAVGRFFPNLLVLLICVVLSYGPFLLAALFNNTIAYFVVYVYHFLLGLTLPGLIFSFILNPAMDKLMMPKDISAEEPESAEKGK